MNKRQQSPFYLILILGSLSTISPFSIDMYLPGFPAIAKDLHTNIASVQLSLTSYFIGIAVGQLMYGPLLDRFGRKPPLYAGLAIYILASLGCAFSFSVESLITMRFFQAIGGCAGMVTSQTLVRDLFPTEKVAQVLSWMTLVIAVSPMIAPTTGGYLTTLFGWHSMFILLGVIAVMMMASVYFVLPSGKKADKTISLKPDAVLRNFYTVVKQPQFLTYTLAGGLAAATPFAFIAGSPDVFINLYGATPQEYGWIFAIIAGIMIASTQLNHLLLRKFTSQKIIKVNISIQSVIGIVLIIGTVLNWYDKFSLTAMLTLFIAGHGITNPNANALSLAPFSKHIGSAASLGGSFRMAMGGVASALVSIFYNGTALPMVAVMTGCVFSGALFLLIGRTAVKYRARMKDIEEEPSSVL